MFRIRNSEMDPKGAFIGALQSVRRVRFAADSIRNLIPWFGVFYPPRIAFCADTILVRRLGSMILRTIRNK